MDTAPIQKKSKSRVILIVVAVVLVLLIVGGAVYALIGVGKQNDDNTATTTQSTSAQVTNVSLDEVNTKKSKLDEAVQNAQTTHSSTVSTINQLKTDSQTKVSQ